MQGRKHRAAKGKREATKASNLGGNKAESSIVRGREGEQKRDEDIGGARKQTRSVETRRS